MHGHMNVKKKVIICIMCANKQKNSPIFHRHVRNIRLTRV
jgi:hypothetical protein